MSYHQQLLDLAIEWEIKAGKLLEKSDELRADMDRNMSDDKAYIRKELDQALICQSKAKDLMIAAKILRQEMRGEN